VIEVIAEVSANHLGKIERAKQLILAARDSGANYVKFQHYRPDTITVRGKHPDLFLDNGTIWDGQPLWELYESAMTPWDWTAELASYCNEVGISWFSTPFDESAVDFLEAHNPPLYKVASFEIIDLPLIRHIARTGKPIILSTGMASVEEIDAAVAAASTGTEQITLLRTNSSYPAPQDEMDLVSIRTMQERWGLPVGLSDHTLGNLSAIVAVGLGARIFEKHLTVKRSDGGPDSAFSAEPHELTAYIKDINQAVEILGHDRFGPSASEIRSLMFRPSLRAIRDIQIGEKFTRLNVTSVRPAGGLPPQQIETIEKNTSARFIRAGDPILESDISDTLGG
jgi:pseudaminic acid synthase